MGFLPPKTSVAKKKKYFKPSQQRKKMYPGTIFQYIAFLFLFYC